MRYDLSQLYRAIILKLSHLQASSRETFYFHESVLKDEAGSPALLNKVASKVFPQQ